jgi:hypothetical protein
MADNLHGQGIVTARFDRDSDVGKGILCRVRNGSVVRGEIVQLDIGATDALTTAAIIGGVSVGGAALASGHMATVITVPDTTSDTSRTAIYGVVNSLGTTADDATCHVIFGQKEYGVFVKALAAAAIDKGDALVVDSHTVAGVGGLNDAGVGKVVAFATADTSAAGLTTVLFNGISGFGFVQT